MSKSKPKIPKTIADLDIKLEFQDKEISIFTIYDLLRKSNSDILKFRIKPVKYTFHIQDQSFEEYGYLGMLVEDLLVNIDGSVSNLGLSYPMILNRFELISKNEFRIHLKEQNEKA